MGDSGEELGEASITEVLSNVESVVGEDSVDSEVAEEMLSRC